MNNLIRVYADTSVYGGVFDEEFATASRVFFDLVRAGRFHLVASTLVEDELLESPQRVRSFFEEMQTFAEPVDIAEEATSLQEAYLAAGIVGPKCESDAMHVAMATQARCAVIVSWNFKHIVNFQKIPLYNGVNLCNGYVALAIHTPSEVIVYEQNI